MFIVDYGLAPTRFNRLPFRNLLTVVRKVSKTKSSKSRMAACMIIVLVSSSQIQLPLLNRTTMDLLTPLSRTIRSRTSSHSHNILRTYATPSPSSTSSSSSSRPNPNYHSRRSEIIPLPARPKPDLPTFFTGKPIFESALSTLETTINKAQSSLRKLHIWPLPKDLQAEVIQDKKVGSWKPSGDLTGYLATPLRTSQYRRLTTLLNSLSNLREISRRTGRVELVTLINDSLQPFERKEGEGAGLANQRLLGTIDEHGRSYTVGRRKTSSAQVWMIKTKIPKERLEYIANPPTLSTPSSSSTTTTLLDLRNSSSSSGIDPSTLPPSIFKPILTQILINSLPIHTVFPRPIDRETILRPLRLTGLLGAFNIYALTRGGGTSGQAGAVALGIARGILTHVERGEMATSSESESTTNEGEEEKDGEEEGEDTKPISRGLIMQNVREVLLLDGALNRDPRMVERKKTGMEKARKKVSVTMIFGIRYLTEFESR